MPFHGHALMFLLCLCGAALPTRAAPAEPSAEATQYAKALLARMTLDEKIGQTVTFTSHWNSTGPTGDSRNVEDLVRAGTCGSVFNARTVAYIRKLQHLAVDQTRLHVPLLFGYDVIHGYNTIFPIPLAEASSWDLDAIEASERIAATEAAASGLNWAFAPMVDIARDPRWGRIAEGAGEDPYLGAQIARARVRGFQGKGFADALSVMACVKHFAGYGAAQAGRDYNTTDLSERTLREVYLPPFQAAVDAGAWSIMTAFNDLDGTPATANRFLLQRVLRGEWGFKGFVVTDYNAVSELVDHGIATDPGDAARLALGAGVDLDMQSGAYLDHLAREVSAGRVDVRQIEAAAQRVLEAKYMLGLFADPYRYLDEQREAALGAAPEHLVAARDMARRSIVLLKNRNAVLPLKPGLKLAVIGPLANDRRDLLGCWKAAGKADHIETVFEALKAANGSGNVEFANGCGFTASSTDDIPAALAVADRADVVVMVLGESAAMSGEAASRTDIRLPGRQTSLLRAIRQLGKPVVTVLVNGRPLALEEETELSDALVEAWAPGSSGGAAIADVLLGQYNPTGKLPVTFPRTLGQVPVFYNHKNTGRPYHADKPKEKYRSTYLDCPNDPLFPFGFGLSYTTFEYAKPKIDGATMRSGEKLTMSVRVTNSGSVAGAEVVQFYLHDLVGSVTRPVLELKGFRRIELAPGESKDVSFVIDEPMLGFWRADMTWGSEPGQFQAFVGPNSRDLQSVDFELLTP